MYDLWLVFCQLSETTLKKDYTKTNVKILKSSLEFVMAKYSTLTNKYMECDKSYDKKLNKDLIKRSENT